VLFVFVTFASNNNRPLSFFYTPELPTPTQQTVRRDLLANRECSCSPRYAHCTDVPPACDDIASAVIIQAGSTLSKAIAAAPAIMTVTVSAIQTLNHPRISTVDAPGVPDAP